MRKSELEYRRTIDCIDDAIHVVDADLRMILLNKAAIEKSRELGVDIDDAVGRRIFDVYPFLPDSVREEYRKVIETGEVVNTDERIVIKGRKFYSETRKIPVVVDGKADRVVTIIHDVSERKLAEARLLETTGLLQSIMDSATEEVIVATDPEGGILIWNEGAKRLLGYDSGEVVEKENIRIFHTEEYLASGRIETGIEKMIATGEPLATELTYLAKDGRTFPVHQIVTPRFSDSGEFVGMLGMARDITRQKELERNLHQSFDKLKKSYEELAIPVIQAHDRVLVIPVVGVLDDMRINQLRETMLHKIADTKSLVAILDITAIKSIDSNVANRLLETVASARLLGAECILTGISPEVAAATVRLSLDAELVTRRTLREGLWYALKVVGQGLTRDREGI